MTAVDTAARNLPRHRGAVHMSDDLAEALLRDRAAVAAQAADLQRLLDLNHLKAVVVTTELGPAVLLRDVERILGGAS